MTSNAQDDPVYAVWRAQWLEAYKFREGQPVVPEYVLREIYRQEKERWAELDPPTTS